MTIRETYGRPVEPIDITIASGASKSETIYLGGLRPVALIAPAAWTAASVTFEASLDSATWYPLVDATGTEVALTMTAGALIPLSQSSFYGFTFLKVRSGTSATPVNQAADRAMLLVVG